MSAARLMFVSHTGKIAGAELVLLDVAKAWPGASAFLFEDGPLNAALASEDISVRLSRWGRGITQIHRDSSIIQVVPLVGRLGAIVLEVARESRNCDIVYANSQKAFVLCAIATTLTRRPLVWHLHDIINGAHFGAMQRRLQVALANRRATKVIVPSQAAATAFIEEGGRRDLVVVIANGIDGIPEQQTPVELRRVLRLPDGPLLGVFSRLAPWKGQHVVLHALTKLPGVNCIIAGEALFGEDAYAAELKRTVNELGLSDRVHFLGQRSDVPRLMRAVDVVIHPSIDPEPFGRTLVEAMLAGVPVIATNNGAAPDILDQGRAGSLIAPNDPEVLAKAIRDVLAGDLAEQLIYAGTRARARYGVKQMLDAITQLVGRLTCGVAA
jgi:glycosyltransferase involved in cell wall biosynthesis